MTEIYQQPLVLSTWTFGASISTSSCSYLMLYSHLVPEHWCRVLQVPKYHKCPSTRSKFGFVPEFWCECLENRFVHINPMCIRAPSLSTKYEHSSKDYIGNKNYIWPSYLMANKPRSQGSSRLRKRPWERGCFEITYSLMQKKKQNKIIK